MNEHKKAEVSAALANIIASGNRLADAKAKEMLLDLQRPQVKSQAIARIMSQPDPEKGGKPYSATAAADVVMNDGAFALHETNRRTATADTIRASGEYEASKLAARFAITECEVESFEPLRLALTEKHTMALG